MERKIITLLICIIALSTNPLLSQENQSGNDFKATPTKGQAPLEVQFIDKSSNFTMEWNWTFEGGRPATSNYKNPVVVYDSPGVYSVQLILKDINGYDTIYKENMIVARVGKPIADFTVENTLGVAPYKVRFYDKSQNMPTSWIWEFTGGEPDHSTKKNPVVVYRNPGRYSVKLIAYNSAGADQVIRSGYITVYNLAGTTEINMDEAISIYPNPASEFVNVNLAYLNPGKQTEIILYDGAGKQVAKQAYDPAGNKFDVRGLSSGLYIIGINTDHELFKRKLILEPY